ncbi:MAG TPA: DUF4339 domain-containing protein [Candidatus Sulfotelmatobacter sp.]|nr:DUF4339 domain-containing protein [Candidatus Sulfotelmatobacter sp.]
MKYYIQRQLNEYGPYTLADLQRYVAQGSILLTDLTRSEGMTEWVPVSQVIGNIPIPVPAAAIQIPGAQSVAGGTVYGGTGAVYGAGTVYSGAAAMPAADRPIPQNFHWALVLLIGICTCGLFNYAWLIVEAAFVRKIKPESKGLLFIVIAIAGFFVGGFVNGFLGALDHSDSGAIGGIISLAALVLYIVGVFQIKGDLEEYYNSVEPINLRLSGVMTFFFNVYYFQYHFSRIAQWKKTGVLQPQN